MSYDTHHSGAQIDANAQAISFAGKDASGDSQTSNWQANASLLSFDRESMQAALASIKAMENRESGVSAVTPGQALITDLSSTKDWEAVDVKEQFGITRIVTGTGESLHIDRIPGPDGKTYALEYNREGQDARATFFEVDANGKRTEVTDPALLQELSQRAKLINVVDLSKDRLSALALTPEQKSAMDSIAAAVKAQDSASLKDAIDSFLKNGGTKETLFMALPAELQVKTANAMVAGGHSKDGVDTISLLVYNEASGEFDFNFNYTFPK